jgi:hypothetical protein
MQMSSLPYRNRQSDARPSQRYDGTVVAHHPLLYR